MRLNCIVIDQRRAELEIIEEYICGIPFLALMAKCNSPAEAHDLIKTNFDIAIIDISMPGLGGVQFLDSIKRHQKIIITADDFDNTDDFQNCCNIEYFPKPFAFGRFVGIVGKIVEKMDSSLAPRKIPAANRSFDFIFANTSGKTQKVLIKDILYIKGMSDYIILKTKDKSHVLRDNLRNAERMLCQANFIRVHKSYIVSFDKIDAIEGGFIAVNGESIPIGRLYRESLVELISAIKLG